MSEKLMLGEIGSTTAPSVGAELYVLSDRSYGQQVASIGGEDDLMDTILQDESPGGRNGIISLRRITVVVGWQFGGFSIQVTPIVDFERSLQPTTFALAAPDKRRIQTLNVPVAARCTWVSARLRILVLTGRIELLGWGASFLPVKSAAAEVGR